MNPFFLTLSSEGTGWISSVHICLNFIYQTHICRQFKKSHTNHHSTFPGVRAMKFYTTFNNISAILWRSVLIGGGNRRKPPRKSLTNFITLQYSWQHTLINAEHLKGSALNAEVLLGVVNHGLMISFTTHTCIDGQQLIKQYDHFPGRCTWFNRC